MKLESISLRFFTYLARFVGAIWALGGVVFVVSAVVDPERRLVYLIVGAFFLVAGIALIVAKRPTAAEIERLKQSVAAAGGKKEVPKG